RLQPRHRSFEPYEGLFELPHPATPEAEGRFSVHLLELPETTEILRPGFARESARPQCPGDLADIEVATRIDAHAVRADEPGRPEARMRVAKPAQEFTLVVDDTDART